MAITNARMQMRRGLEADFDPDKMQPGEWAVSLDKKYVRMCFSVGLCVRMATYEAFEEDMEQIKEILSTCETIEEAVAKINTEVSTNAQAVAEYTKQAKKYRDEAKKFRDEAESIAGIGIATKDKAGIVKPDGTTITVDEDGTIHSSGGGGTTNYADLENKPKINGVELSGNKTLADLKITTADSKDNTVTFSQADTREKILSNEKHSTLFGKIAKWLSDLKTVAFSGSYSDLSNKPSSLDTYEEIMANTESGKFAGTLGVQEGFETLTNSLNTKQKAPYIKDFLSVAITPSGSFIDISALDSNITYANYKHIDVSFYDQNLVGNVFAIGSAVMYDKWWRIWAISNTEAYFTVHVECY